jgi:hypothetical protein
MLGRFDWLRRSRTGPELLATLRYLEATPELPTENVEDPRKGGELGPPSSALDGPCQRCWVYPRAGNRYCATCQAILDGAWKLRSLIPEAIVVWGFVNRLPRQRPGSSGFADSRILGMYVHDEHHFLLMLRQQELKPWLQELVLYHGADLKGLLQIFPPADGKSALMGDLLALVIHQEARFPPDRLRVRFFSRLVQVFHPRPYEREGVLNFAITEFMNTLELAAVFRSVLRPDEQKMLYKLLHTADSAESQFLWGRFLGMMSQEARDMLNAWGVRQWSEYQISLLYELVDYVAFYR